MTAGTLIVIIYWVIFTVRKHYTPKLTAAERANVYDLHHTDPDVRKAAQGKCGGLTAAKWALRIAGWAENVLAVLLIVWIVFLIGALLTGTVIVFGYPV